MGKQFKVLVTCNGASLPKLEEIATLITPVDLNIPRELNKQEVIQHIKDCDGVFCTPRNGGMASKLKVIGTYSVGFEHIDLEECKKRKIKVGYTPNVLTEAVAETAMTLLLATARKLPMNLRMARDWTNAWKTWDCFLSCGAAIEGSTVGIFGYGRIGGSVVEKLVPFHPKRIIYHDIFKKEGGPAQYVEFEELLSASDFIIITVALTETSRGKFNKEVLLKMKKGAILLNISRGVIVNTNDLVEALKSGHLGGAGLDVVDPEPLPSDHPLFSMENVVITPHIGSANVRCRQVMVELTEENIVNGLTGRPLPASLVDF